MADVEWQKLLALQPEPAVSTGVGELMLLVFTQNGVPTWEAGLKRVAVATIPSPTALPTRSRRQRPLHSSKQGSDPQNEE